MIIWINSKNLMRELFFQKEGTLIAPCGKDASEVTREILLIENEEKW